MQYQALATDYDGTLAHDGHVDPLTIDALHRLRTSGRKVILVTGRELPELKAAFPDIGLCDVVVAENGALLYWPGQDKEEILGEAPSSEFVAAFNERNIKPFSVGRVIVATWHPHETAVLQVIQDLGLEYHIIFNKGAVMVLPSGINKATGLAKALKRLKITPQHVAAIGDAENDHAFLDSCAMAVAVDNALPALKMHCDMVTAGDHGRGVIELIDRILADDLQSLGPRKPRKEMTPRTVAPTTTAPTTAATPPNTVTS